MYVGFIMHTELQHCSIYCQKLTNTEHIFFIRNWRDSLRCLIWVKFSIFTCVKAVCPKLYGEFFCLQFLKVLKLISPIEIIFSIPHSSLSIHVWRVTDEIFWLMWEILFDSFQLLVTNQMIFFQTSLSVIVSPTKYFWLLLLCLIATIYPKARLSHIWHCILVQLTATILTNTIYQTCLWYKMETNYTQHLKIKYVSKMYIFS